MPTANKKRILIFCLEFFPYIGGAEVAVKEICRRVPEFEFHMLTCRNSKQLPKTEFIDNIQIIRIGPGRRGIDKYLFPFLSFIKAVKLYKQQKYDLIWAIMANQAGLGALFFKLKFPQVKYLLTLQNGESNETVVRKAWFVWPLYKLIYKKADKVHAISNYLANRAWRMIGYQGPLKIIPNGVSSIFFIADQRKDKTGEDVFQVITTSRLEPQKGLADLIRGVALLKRKYQKPFQLIIIGEGKLSGKLRRLTKKMKLEKEITFLGQVDYKNIPHYLAKADVFIRPSLSEGLGNSFLEAMAAGLPVIGTPVGGIVDFLKDKQTGLFCQPNNPQSIADSLFLLLTNKQLRQYIAENGRKLVEEKYKWDNIVKLWKEDLTLLV